MKKTRISIITCDSGMKISRGYSNLRSNDEEQIMRFIFAGGFTLEYGFTEDSHDIGDQEWDSSSFSGVEGLLQSLARSFGECRIQARFLGEKIEIYKPYPNIYHGLDFSYGQSLEEKLQTFFAYFEKNFCYEDISIWREDR